MTFPHRFGAGGPWAEMVALPSDPQGFLRRECPSCHRLFKVRETRRDGLLVFRQLAQKVPHANENETEIPTLAMRTCPYCRHRATEDSWFTAEQRRWLEKRAETFAQELRYERLAHVERTLDSNPNPTFLPVRPDPATGRLRAEPDDMRRMPLLCCVEEVRISEAWNGAIYCFFCGAENALDSGLLRERLSKVLH